MLHNVANKFLKSQLNFMENKLKFVIFFHNPSSILGSLYICFCFCLLLFLKNSSISNLRLNSYFFVILIGIFVFAQLEYLTFSISNFLPHFSRNVIFSLGLLFFSPDIWINWLFARGHKMKAYCSSLYKINLLLNSFWKMNEYKKD